jgi:hypothetical protein
MKENQQSNPHPPQEKGQQPAKELMPTNLQPEKKTIEPMLFKSLKSK